MRRVSTKSLIEYARMAKENEALWAVVGVLAMVVFMEIYQWV
jgi:hypothetical protein